MMRRVLNTQPEHYNTLEELRADKRKLSRQVRKSMRTLQEGAKQCLMPDSQYVNSSNKYMRFIGYGLTAWKTARTVNRIMKFFRK